MKSVDFKDDESFSVASSANGDPALELVKIEFVRQSLKRGLADLESGRIQDGDPVFISMIYAEDR